MFTDHPSVTRERCGFIWYNTATGKPYLCVKPPGHDYRDEESQHITSDERVYRPETAATCFQAAHGFGTHYDQLTGVPIAVEQRYLPAGERTVTVISTCWRCGTEKHQLYNSETYTPIGPVKYNYPVSVRLFTHPQPIEHGEDQTS